MEQETGVKPIVTMWDGDFLPFYICHTKEGETTKTLEECKQVCDDFINNVNSSCNADYYGGYLTVGKKCFRYSLNPEYKANRKYDKMPTYFHEIRAYLYDKHNFTWQEEYEADDLVVSFKVQNSQYETIIVSPDKDVLNTMGKHYNPRKNEFIEVYTTYVADRYFWESMIVGDTIDGIKGIPKKGKVYASKVTKRYANEYNVLWSSIVLDEYIRALGEYQGIQEFYKNYVSLKIIDNVKLKDIKLNKIDKIFCE